VDGFVLITTTSPDRDSALRLARTLVDRGLAACAQVMGGLRSVYIWKGRVEEADEVLLLVKTRDRLLPGIRETLRELHPYEVPELAAVPITAGSPGYLVWLEECLGERTT
jgi:periplasmic divalent cation tolerance protein